jgi:hypothetical protein
MIPCIWYRRTEYAHDLTACIKDRDPSARVSDRLQRVKLLRDPFSRPSVLPRLHQPSLHPFSQLHPTSPASPKQRSPPSSRSDLLPVELSPAMPPCPTRTQSVRSLRERPDNLGRDMEEEDRSDER